MVSQTYMLSVLALTVQAASAGLVLTIGLLGQDALITRSRNTLLAQFMATSATHILFIDADIGFEPSQVFRLLEADRDIVGALYPLRAHHWTEAARERLASGEPIATAGLEYVGEPVEQVGADGFIRGTFAGTGFLLVSRTAVDRMIAAYPDTRCRHGHVLGSVAAQEVHALFDCFIDPETRFYLSEDYGFCSRWRALGGEIWLDTRALLTHCGMSEFHGSPTVRFGRHDPNRPAQSSANAAADLRPVRASHPRP
jgi:hypothetical protein